MGGVTVFLALTFLGESGPIKPSQPTTMAAPAGPSGSGVLPRAEQLINMFEAIANDRSEAERSNISGKASDYDDCLNNCTKNFSMMEESDKALLINCRRECMALYAERLKSMRKRYYSDPNPD